MKSLLHKLKEICTSHPYSEKCLVVDSYRTGEQILHAYTNQGNYAINIRIMTLKEMAKKIIEKKSSIYNELIVPPIGSFLMSTLLKKLQVEKKLHYFHELEISPNLSRSIFQTIQTLRLAGYTSINLPTPSFSSIKKANDLVVILHEYEELLKNNQLWDESIMFREAIKLADLSDEQNTIYIFQPNLAFLELEEQLMGILMQKQSFILPVAPVFGAEIPTRFPFIRDAIGEPTSLSYLFEEKPELDNKKDLELFASLTEECEINEVLRRIKDNDLPFDSYVIFYSSRDSYQMIMYQITEKLGIPVTFGEGLPITVSRPGRLFSGLLKWLKNQCNVSNLISLIQEGMIDFGKDAPSASAIITMLRNAEIGWGKERYGKQIEKQIEKIKGKADQNEGKKKEYYQTVLREYTWLKKWFANVFNSIPSLDHNLIDLRNLFELFRRVIENYASIQSSLDDSAKNVLLEQMDAVYPFVSETMTWYDAFLQIEDLLFTTQIGASAPKPGSIHLTSYKHGMYMDRSHLFFIGFDHQKFPGKMLEDPLLLDHERQMLHVNLPLETEKSKENLYFLLQALASAKGHPTISYSMFDQLQNRSNHPSYFFLKCYRYQTGETDADFETIINNYKDSTKPTSSINQTEWWQVNLQIKDVVLSDQFLMNKYQHIAAGEIAKHKKESGKFTEYEGNIHVVESALDPRKNKEIRMSSSRIEKLAACPYKYFLEDVLKVSPPETFSYDPNVWLDAKTRGILLHEIFEWFYRTVQKQGELPSYGKHEALLISIATERIHAHRDQLAPPSKWVFEQEANEILESCRIFLKSEEEHGEGIEPIHFEYSFGIGEIPPADIHLRNGEYFHLSGKIDRVDKDHDNHFSIVDYKTGKANHYHRKNYFHGGRQLQHFLYAKALESHLQLEAGKVKTSTYLFPTLKGTGERRVRIQDEGTRENGHDIVERLLDVLKYGSFTMTDNVKMDCTYCDFKHVCKRSSYSEDVFENKEMDSFAEGIKRWKGVRAYD